MNPARLARMFLVLLFALLGAIFIPRAYWLAFDERVYVPRVYYSPVSDAFLFLRPGPNGTEYRDASGKNYTREEFERLTPLANYRQLAASGTMPDSLRGVRLDLREVNLNNIVMWIIPELMDAPPFDLLPMFESQSGRIRLEMPDGMFRITSRLEFITAATNTIDTLQSRRFTDAMLEAGFRFPPRDINGNPTTLKAFDEGYFVTDAAGRVFHLKKVRGEPYCRDIGVPASVAVRKIIVQEMPLREFYGILIADDGSVSLISYDRYALVRLPLEGYDPSTMTLKFTGDRFFRTITLEGPGGLRTVVTDRQYGVVARYGEQWPTRRERTPGVVASFLFPFTISLSDRGSLFLRPFVQWSGLPGLAGIAVSLVLIWFLMRVRKQKFSSRWFDFLVVACSGVFGLLAAALIEDFDE